MYVIGICGGSCSGKSRVCQEIIDHFKDNKSDITRLEQDHFYKGLPANTLAENYNFDSPESIDFELMVDCLQQLLRGIPVQIPVYDFHTHQRMKDTYVIVKPAPIILIDGILIFQNAGLMELINLRVFVSADSDTRLMRRLQRDVVERGRCAESVLKQYSRFVKPSHLKWVQPCKRQADIILVNDNQENTFTGLPLLCEFIRNGLDLAQNPSKSNFRKVIEFNQLFGIQQCKSRNIFTENSALIKSRMDLIREEVEELEQAVKDHNRAETVDALGDILYVTYGMAYSLGIDMDYYYDQIHRSNMSKLCSNEDEANETIRWYSSHPELGYDSPDKVYMEECGKWKVFNRSTGKVLKSIKYNAVDFSHLNEEDENVHYI